MNDLEVASACVEQLTEEMAMRGWALALVDDGSVIQMTIRARLFGLEYATRLDVRCYPEEGERIGMTASHVRLMADRGEHQMTVALDGILRNREGSNGIDHCPRCNWSKEIPPYTYKL